MVRKKDEGFIVHPFETMGGYSASYGDHNKTGRSFKTLSKAKAYLKSKGMKTALYDSPSGVKILKLDRKIKLKQKVKRRMTRTVVGSPEWIKQQISL